MKSRGTALSTRIVRAGLAGLLLLPLGVTAPWAMADGGQGDYSSDVPGSAEGAADGGGVVTISVESSVTTAGSGGGDGGGVTSSLSFSRVVNLPVVKV